MFDNIQVDDNIPAPPAHGACRYPFNRLIAAGQSLYFPADVSLRKLSRAAHMYAARHGFRAAVRKMEDGGVRVWRLD